MSQRFSEAPVPSGPGSRRTSEFDQKAYNRAYYLANAEKIKARSAARRAANLSEAQEYDRTYAAAHREEARQRAAAWAAKNPERKRANDRAWKAANPEAVRASNGKRRALKRGATTPLTTRQWLDILEEFDHCCAYCQTRGVELEQEHITPLSRGGQHTRHNVVPSCTTCNDRKGIRNLFEFATLEITK